MVKGKRLRFHKHDCFELIRILEGSLSKISESRIYKPKEVHDVIAQENTRMIIKFYK